MGEKARKPRLGDILVARRVITADQLRKAIIHQKQSGDRLGSTLVKLGFLTEDQLTKHLSKQLGVEAVAANDLEIDEEIVRLLPNNFVKRFEVVPVKLENGVLTLATASPNNLSLLDEARFVSGIRRVVPMVAPEVAIRRVIEKHYSTHSLLDEIIQSGGLFDKALRQIEKEQGPQEDEASEEAVFDLKTESEAQPIVALVNFLLIESVRRSASDIHVEPYEEYFRVRMRIDGMLHTILNPPQRLHRPMVSRMKIMSGMDIAKSRLPQDGHIGLEYTGEVLHYRVNTLPTVYGEKVVARLMKKEAHLADLDRLGVPDLIYQRLQRVINLPQGLILITGPTGSGKTTTVHAGLNAINREDNNIVSLEDPVESTIAGVNHVQIHRQAGMTFVNGIRAILRQDPDVVFVGEIRDREVAQTAMEASMTGHLVFSTLHTNSAIEALTRLDDMEVEMFLVAGALQGVLAQRLARRNCPQCKEEDPEMLDVFRRLGVPEELVAKATPMRGKGCNHCLNSGYKGRVGVYEGFFLDEEIRALVRKRATVEEITAVARANGMRDMGQCALDFVMQGMTTIDEAMRAVGSVVWRDPVVPSEVRQAAEREAREQAALAARGGESAPPEATEPEPEAEAEAPKARRVVILPGEDTVLSPPPDDVAEALEAEGSAAEPEATSAQGAQQGE